MSTPALFGHAVPESALGPTAPEEFIETYCCEGVWASRRHDSEVPFASGGDELDQIALGSQVARWNRLPHVVRTATGEIAEILTAG